MRSGAARFTLLIGISVVLLLAGQALLPGFLSAGQVANQLKIAAFLGLFGLCQTIVIGAGGQGLDLSVGALATLGGITGAALMHGSNSATAYGTAVAAPAGLVAGSINGIGIVMLGIPPLVATLAMASVVNGGLIVFVSVAQPSSSASPLLVSLAGRATRGVPNIVVLWIVVTAVVVWLLAHSAWGRRLAGTGSRPTC